MSADIYYFFDRAREEMVRAMRATHPQAARIHQELSTRYVERVRRMLRMT